MKKLALLSHDDIDDVLHGSVGRGSIGRVIGGTVRPHLPAGDDMGAAFGLLAHLARPAQPATEQLIVQYKRRYLAQRYASKLDV